MDRRPSRSVFQTRQFAAGRRPATDYRRQIIRREGAPARVLQLQGARMIGRGTLLLRSGDRSLWPDGLCCEAGSRSVRRFPQVGVDGVGSLVPPAPLQFWLASHRESASGLDAVAAWARRRSGDDALAGVVDAE